mgnify:CR=1 FL=1
MNTTTQQRLSFAALISLVVGSMVGSAIFALPAAFGRATGVVGAIVAWCIAGVGMLMLALVFQTLSRRRPELDSGIYAYARAGFGEYAGFASVLGYWMGCCLADVACLVLFKATLGQFFPVFGDGTTAFAIVCASVLLWAVHVLILRGIKQAAALNTIATVAKLLPIATFLFVAVVGFQRDVFAANLWGEDGPGVRGVAAQVRATLLVTVFAFVGIEGASVYSRYAQKREDVGFATVSGFFIVTTLMVLVTLLPYAVLERSQIAGMRQPSMAAGLEAVVGPWGAVFVSIGLLISVLGAYLAWSLICAEVLFAAAKNRDMPRVFATENANKVPSAALWATNIVLQLIVITTYWSRDAFALMLNLTSAMSLIPLLLVAGFAVMVVRRGDGYAPDDKRSLDLFIAGLATVYTIFLLFAGGLKFMVLSAVLYAPGTALYVWARREQGVPVFSRMSDWVIFIAAAIGAIVGVWWIATGYIAI